MCDIDSITTYQDIDTCMSLPVEVFVTTFRFFISKKSYLDALIGSQKGL